MSITSYIPNKCKYSIPRLDSKVYLIEKSWIGRVHIDYGEAYIDNITHNPLSYDAYSITVNDSDTLKGRYEFSQTISFSINGYHNIEDLGGLYHIIVKDIEGNYWLLNPEFPCKVTYTYTLDSDSSHTDFQLGTVSNYPMFRVRNTDFIDHSKCDEYFIDGFKELSLNLSEYSMRDGNNIRYTNDGFKDILFSKGIFREVYDGDILNHTITFNISLDSYKDSWHYELLEFIDNRYAAIIGTKEGRKMLCGFHSGLRPSFTVNGSDTEYDYIEITLDDYHNTDEFVSYTDITIDKDDSLRWVYIKDMGFDCIGQNVARYILMAEVDAKGNRTGRYKCLKGYESKFSNLNIVGTFEDNVTFPSVECADETCKFQTSIPKDIKFQGKECKRYYILCDTDWTMTPSKDITVTPNKGVGGQNYEVEICSLTDDAFEGVIQATYCNGMSKVFTFTNYTEDECFPKGFIYDISANAQYVTVPMICCVNSASEIMSRLPQIEVSGSVIKVFVPKNESGNDRTFTVVVYMCDGTTKEIIINQSNAFERWVLDSTQCNDNGELCDIERKYTGTTEDNINTPTIEVRSTNCRESIECLYVTRWVENGETYCSGEVLYMVEIEEMLYGVNDWRPTGNKRLGRIVQGDNSCVGIVYTYKWELTNETICQGFDKYRLYKQYRRSAGSSVWEEVIPTTLSYNGNGEVEPVLVESNSVECGYYEPIYKWIKVNNDYMCDECGSKPIDPDEPTTYKVLFKTDAGDIIIPCDDEETLYQQDTKEYRDYEIYEAFVGDCIETTNYYSLRYFNELTKLTLSDNVKKIGFESFTDNTSLETVIIGDGIASIGSKVFSGCTNLKEIFIYAKTPPSISYDTFYKDSWGPQQGLKIYVPKESVDTYKKLLYWTGITAIEEKFCKYEKLRKYVSYDNGVTWSPLNEYSNGELIEYESDDCLTYDKLYRWYSDGTMCVGFAKYERLVYQISYNGGYTWDDVEPLQIKTGAKLEDAPSKDCTDINVMYRWVDTDEYIIVEEGDCSECCWW